MAQENFRKAGMAGIIDARLGDAFEVIPALDGPFDVVFIDIGNGDLTRRFFDLVYPKVRTGGVILCHAVAAGRGTMPDFLKYIKNHPQLESFVIPMTRAGISASYKKE